MIQKIGTSIVSPMQLGVKNNVSSTVASNAVNTVPSFSKNYTATSLVSAYQAFHGINTAKTISFGQGLRDTFDSLKQVMYTCRDEKAGKQGEKVGQRIEVSQLMKKHEHDLPYLEDAIKTNIIINSEKDKDDETKPAKITEARTQLKKTNKGILYEMSVRPKRLETEVPVRTKELTQSLKIFQQPGAPEQAYVLNTKGNLMAVVEDGDNVILANAGKFTMKDTPEHKSTLDVQTTTKGNYFKKFDVSVPNVVHRVPTPSVGEGTEIVIGMEDGRFVPEIISSLEEFVKKVDNEEIVLPQFVANPDAKNIQLAMLAGGFGSRAEYTNASSDAIFHSKKDGANSTKGVFRTATGLTPMETTFVSLHKAGLLDCSKGKLKIGDNIKLYLNKSGINKGNGGFTVDLYNKMERDGRQSLAIFPNDSMSRMTDATKKMFETINSGKASVAMIAKKVKEEDARGKLGIMSIDKDTHEIKRFAEKPETIDKEFLEGGMCLTNTFQFAISKEGFKAISIIEPFVPDFGKESRDWSKTFIPILMNLSQYEDDEKSRHEIGEAIRKAKKDDNFSDEAIPLEKIAEAKEALNGQRVYSIPTDEPWADCGTLNALYYTTLQVASGVFPLEDFERQHVIDSINNDTGLVASTPEQKKEIESKYTIDGQVMVVPKAKKVDKALENEYIKKGLITINK
ncbi:hypothetical protein IJ182_04615 [bacterium]|nr:hypothetical protein [bacterium]